MIANLALMGIATLTATEIGMRFMDIPYRDVLHASAEFQYDPALGLKAIPGFTGDVGIYHSDISINAHGFRDEDWDAKLERAAASDARKILCIGDSTLYGYRIHRDERITEALAQRYREHGRPAEVFNAGMPSYGTGQEFRLLQQLLPELAPDVVILRFCENDFGDTALPYDHRFPHRVYTPFYDLQGELVLNRKVPRRFSLLVEGTPLERLHTRFAIDRLQYALDDLRFRRYIHLWDTPPDGVRREWTREQKEHIVAHLDYMVRDPQMASFFEANKQRVFSLWLRMREVCRRNDARFVILTDIPPPEQTSPQYRSILQFLEDSAIDWVNTCERIEPVRPWAEVRGDGHPNGIDNYLSALTLFNHLESADDTPTYTEAPWFSRVPIQFDFGRPHPPDFLFGEWGRAQGASRQVGTNSRLLLRHDPRQPPAELWVTGHAPPGPAAPEPLGVILNGAESPITGVAPGKPFHRSVPFAATDTPLVFVTLSTTAPYAVRRIGAGSECTAPQRTWTLHIGDGDSPFLRQGFYNAGTGPGNAMVRWTNGDAQCTCCLDPGRDDYGMEIVFFRGYRKGSASPLQFRLEVNGIPLPGAFAPSSTAARAIYRASVPNEVLRLGDNQLRFLSSTFVPAEQGGSRDTRTLGILLHRVELHPTTNRSAADTAPTPPAPRPQGA